MPTEPIVTGVHIRPGSDRSYTHRVLDRVTLAAAQVVTTILIPCLVARKVSFVARATNSSQLASVTARIQIYPNAPIQDGLANVNIANEGELAVKDLSIGGAAMEFFSSLASDGALAMPIQAIGLKITNGAGSLTGLTIDAVVDY